MDLLSVRSFLRGLFILAVPIAILGPAAERASATPIVYDIGTISLSGGYTAVGTITTDGTVGALSIGNILAWSLDVSGQRPYTLTEASPGADVSISLVSATTTELSTTNDIVFVAMDNTTADCTLCEQRLEWSTGNAAVIYQYRDNLDGNPFIHVEMATSDVPLIIATAVPEAATLALLLSGVVPLTVLGLRSRHSC